MKPLDSVISLAMVGAGFAHAQSINCAVETLTITNAAQASSIPCSKLSGSIEVSKDYSGELELNGIKEVQGDIFIQDAPALTSFSSRTIEAVQGRLVLERLASLTTAQMLKLERVSGNLELANNTRLSRIILSDVKKIDAALIIVDNPSLGVIDGFPRLEHVTGRLQLDGNFKYVELPELETVLGDFMLRSTESIGDTCSAFKRMSEENPNDRDFSCEGNYKPPSASPGTVNGNSGGESDSPSSPGLGTGPIVGIVVGVITILAILAAAAFLYVRRRKRGAKAKADPNANELGTDPPAPTEPPELQGVPRVELAVPPPELQGSGNVEPTIYYEMDAEPARPMPEKYVYK